MDRIMTGGQALLRTGTLTCLLLQGALPAPSAPPEDWRAPVVSSTGIRFSTGRTMTLRQGDQARVIPSWRRVLVQSRRPEGMRVRLYDRDGRPVGPARIAFGRCLLFEGRKRLALTCSNNEIDPQPTLILDPDNRIVAQILISREIVDWYPAEGDGLLWTALPSQAGRHFYDCQAYDLEGKLVATRTVRNGEDFHFTHQGREPHFKVQVQEL